MGYSIFPQATQDVIQNVTVTSKPVIVKNKSEL